MFKNRENTIVSAAILYSAVSISDIRNKARMCGKTLKYVTSQLFSALRW